MHSRREGRWPRCIARAGRRTNCGENSGGPKGATDGSSSITKKRAKPMPSRSRTAPRAAGGSSARSCFPDRRTVSYGQERRGTRVLLRGPGPFVWSKAGTEEGRPHPLHLEAAPKLGMITTRARASQPLLARRANHPFGGCVLGPPAATISPVLRRPPLIPPPRTSGRLFYLHRAGPMPLCFLCTPGPRVRQGFT